MITSFSKINTQDRIINQLQDNLGKPISGLLSVPLNQGVFIQEVSLVSGNNDIYTGLGRPYVGWFVTDRDNDATIFREPNDDSNVLTLVSSDDVIVGLFIF